MTLIFTMALPMTLLIGMNIRIYLTMKNTWSMPNPTEDSVPMATQRENLNEKQQQVISQNGSEIFVSSR